MSTKLTVNKFVDISKWIKDTIATTANDAALAKLVQKKADEEIARRADLLDKGLTVWSATEKDLKKCVADIITHVPVEGKEDGELMKVEAFSDARKKEKDTLKERSAKIEIALMLALGKDGDYSKLEEIIKKSGNGNKQEKKPAEATE
jgi:hypothetical protein